MKVNRAEVNRLAHAFLKTPAGEKLIDRESMPLGVGLFIGFLNLVVGAILVVTIVKLPAGLRCLWNGLSLEDYRHQFGPTLRNRSDEVLGIVGNVIIVGSMQPSGKGLALVLITFDDVSDDVMTRLADRFGELYTTDADDVDDSDRAFWTLLHRDSFEENRRRLVPSQYSEGHEFYLCDSPLKLEEAFVAESSRAAFLTTRGPKGVILQMPWEAIAAAVELNDDEIASHAVHATLLKAANSQADVVDDAFVDDADLLDDAFEDEPSAEGVQKSTLCLGMLMTADDPVLEPHAFAAKWSELFPAETKITDLKPTEMGLSCSIGKAGAVIALMPAPIPWSSLEVACESSWMWPEATTALRGHAQHFIVTVFGAETPLESAHVLTQVLAAASACCPQVVGVYWGTADLVHRPDVFLTFATRGSRETPPFMAWVHFRVGTGPAGKMCGFTSGMESLGLPEIETDACNLSAGDLREQLMSLASYLVSHGNVIRDGDTVGGDEHERIRVKLGKSAFTSAKRALKLVFGASNR